MATHAAKNVTCHMKMKQTAKPVDRESHCPISDGKSVKAAGITQITYKKAK